MNKFIVIRLFNIIIKKKIFTNIYMEERGLMMVLHSSVIGLVLYAIMLFGLQQPPEIAENRSIVLAAVILIYMVVFGHGLPNKINNKLWGI